MMRLTVSILPNAKRSEVVEVSGSEWKVRIAAPPIDGKANRELIRILAKELGCSPSQIRLVKGFASRTKLVEVG